MAKSSKIQDATRVKFWRTKGRGREEKFIELAGRQPIKHLDSESIRIVDSFSYINECVDRRLTIDENGKKGNKINQKISKLRS